MKSTRSVFPDRKKGTKSTNGKYILGGKINNIFSLEKYSRKNDIIFWQDRVYSVAFVENLSSRLMGNSFALGCFNEVYRVGEEPKKFKFFKFFGRK